GGAGPPSSRRCRVLEAEVSVRGGSFERGSKGWLKPDGLTLQRPQHSAHISQGITGAGEAPPCPPCRSSTNTNFTTTSATRFYPRRTHPQS
ncbi:hypothetical protein NDU88_008393, partial [Pleurodeles waltl]